MNTCLIDSMALRGTLPGWTHLFGGEYGTRVVAVPPAAASSGEPRHGPRRPAQPAIASRPFH